MVKGARKSDALYVQFNISDNEIHDICEDEEMVWQFIRGEPTYFFNRVSHTPALRASLENSIPFAFYYLLKYGYTNRFVLCLETSNFFSKCYRSFADLYKRAIRTPNSAVVFDRLAVLLSLNSDQLPWTMTKDVYLNAPLSATMFQHYAPGDAFGDFFRYEHVILMKECRTNVMAARELASIYALLYPFGCPNGSYYTREHHELRTIAFQLIVSLASSSLEELKINHPKDVSKHDPLRPSSASITSLFIEEISAVVNANRKLLLACMLDSLPNDAHTVHDDDSYELFLHALLKAKKAAEPMLVQINAAWLHRFVTDRIAPRLPADSYASYCGKFHMTQKSVGHFTSSLRSLMKETLLASTQNDLYYKEVNGTMFDEAIIRQIERSKECPKSEPKDRKHAQSKDTEAEEKLMCSLSTFIERSDTCSTKIAAPTLPLARTLFKELQRVVTEEKADDTPLSYWENHPSVSRDEKLQYIYQMLFLQSYYAK